MRVSLPCKWSRSVGKESITRRAGRLFIGPLSQPLDRILRFVLDVLRSQKTVMYGVPNGLELFLRSTMVLDMGIGCFAAMLCCNTDCAHVLKAW